MNKIYTCIDLKSFYASVECVERHLDPLNTNLVVADNSRTEKTICLAVSPSLKQYGIPGRARLFEVIQKVKKINNERRYKIKYKRFTSSSYIDSELKKNPYLKLDYITAPPRMSKYVEYSTRIYNIYLKYLSPNDIHVYSIDEVFCDITPYLTFNKMKPVEFITRILNDVYDTTGITATAGIGTNMYLAKVAMDIVAKHKKPNNKGVRIACLDEIMYRKLLWNHQPLTDFWRVGSGYYNKLTQNNLYTMGDIARCSLNNEDLLYKLFGINAELLIDHAWGWEPVTIKEIKSYRPTSNSISSGQVLPEPYNYEQTLLIIKEMTDLLTLELVSKKLVTDQIVLTINYDINNLSSPHIRDNYIGEITKDYYGRRVPKPSHGTIRIDHQTSSSTIIINRITELYKKITNKHLLVRRITISFNNLITEEKANKKVIYKQYDIFTDLCKIDNFNKKQKEEEMKERELQKVIIDIKNKYGKNSILRGMNYIKGARTIERNKQIGGHSE
ncbi:MAG: DNA methylase [Bacilli bacterium]|nr:DNA methylase [Bacilli bacterium]